MNSSVTFKITVPHNSMAGWHQWFFPNGWRGLGPTEHRDRAGRARGKRKGHLPEWFVLACNNPECDALAVIPVSIITDLADREDEAVAR